MSESAMDGRSERAVEAEGKASFREIYDQPTPAEYFSALQPLDYATPGRAQPMVRRCVEALRQRRDLDTVTVLDLCSGYGVNSALLTHDLSLDDLYERFATAQARRAGASRIAADAAWFRRMRRRGAGVRMIAQDVAREALAYSKAVGLADAIMPVNLEERDPVPQQAALLRDTDLIVVTGGISYIGERTFSRVLRPATRRPWALYFPLRHSNSDAIDRTFRQAGYVVETSTRGLAHRRYHSALERRRIRSRLQAQFAPGAASASSDYLEAMVKLARPEEECKFLPFEVLLAKGTAER